jgi:hypothetical protein
MCATKGLTNRGDKLELLRVHSAIGLGYGKHQIIDVCGIVYEQRL